MPKQPLEPHDIDLQIIQATCSDGKQRHQQRKEKNTQIVVRSKGSSDGPSGTHEPMFRAAQCWQTHFWRNYYLGDCGRAGHSFYWLYPRQPPVPIAFRLQEARSWGL